MAVFGLWTCLLVNCRRGPRCWNVFNRAGQNNAGSYSACRLGLNVLVVDIWNDQMDASDIPQGLSAPTTHTTLLNGSSASVLLFYFFILSK